VNEEVRRYRIADNAIVDSLQLMQAARQRFALASEKFGREGSLLKSAVDRIQRLDQGGFQKLPSRACGRSA